MARTMTMNPLRRGFNAMYGWLLRRGVKLGPSYLLTVPGRKTGKPRTTPVTLVENDSGRWLVAPYGPVNWVRNVRAAGTVTLSRGRHREQLRAVEVGPDEAAPVLKEYLRHVLVVRPYFDVRPDSPLVDFVTEAPEHPVFRLE